MRLESFNAAYTIKEDRILLQAVGDGIAQNYWITRRAALMLGEGIQNVLAEQCTKFGAQIVASEHVADLLSFDHQSAVSKNPPKPGALIETNMAQAILLYQMSYSAEDADHCTIQLTDEHHQGYRYRLTREMLHAVLNLIQSQCDQAGWGVRLNQLPEAPPVTQEATRALH